MACVVSKMMKQIDFEDDSVKVFIQANLIDIFTWILLREDSVLYRTLGTEFKHETGENMKCKDCPDFCKGEKEWGLCLRGITEEVHEEDDECIEI